MNDQIFIPKPYPSKIDSGSFTWSSPSNIALVKYWGKTNVQIPKNPSISFTLNQCATTTKLSFSKQSLTDFSVEVFFEGELNQTFKPKIITFFQRVEKYLPFLKDYRFKIETTNSFPHSSGIASSASGMSALALCLMSVEQALGKHHSHAFFYKKAAFLARLGSGSACRSLYGGLVSWGAHPHLKNSSDLFGTPYQETEVHDVFKSYHDTILLVDKGEKQVSSTLGHNLMNGHPYAQYRFEQANDNISKLMSILKSGDTKAFINLVESEALTLHAMMMTSDPYFILMKPNTLKIINKIWQHRKETKSNLCFTLDAGANVHLLYPDVEHRDVHSFIETQLKQHCQNGQFIHDRVGKGPILLS